MASWQEDLHVGSSVWCESHKNGIVTRIDWEGKTVYSHHYQNGNTTHDLDEFPGTYDERLNQWIIIGD